MLHIIEGWNCGLSNYHYGFRKGFSTHQCLLALLGKWKRCIDRGKVFGAVL